MSALLQPRPMGVYVHIPFCRTKCPYCAFNSAALPGGPDEKAWAGLFRKDLEHKVRDSGLLASGAVLRSIYLGGGTPSLFSPAAIGEIIGFIKKTLGRGTAGEDETCGANTLEQGGGVLGEGAGERLGENGGAAKGRSRSRSDKGRSPRRRPRPRSS